MSALHEALACLRPKEFSDVPTDNLKTFLPEILSNAETIANSVPPPPDGTPYETSKRTRTSPEPATNAADLTVSEVRRPPPAEMHAQLQKSWGKPVKLGAKEAATGMRVFKMAGNDRHGAWFARTSVHEGLGFAKWKESMQKEFPESLEVQGGPGEGNVRGIGGDQRLEQITVDGIGKLEGTSSADQGRDGHGIDNRSVPTFCTISRTNLPARVYYPAHHFRQLTQRSIQSWR
jgi:hypothetical protein